MNSGIITRRYAVALLDFVEESGSARQVYEQVQSLLREQESLPQQLEPDLERFISVVEQNGRTQYLKFMFHSFLRLYNQAHNIKQVHLSVPEHSPALEQKIRELLPDSEIHFEEEVKPDLIGGFVLKFDDKLLDTSVSHQLDNIRRQLIKKNRRII